MLQLLTTALITFYGLFDICFKGRAGKLQEAYDFIKKMPYEADATVLGVLMGACRLHGAVESGNEVA
ncbi:hypothetical protein MTR67_000268 [Solanum verrucosum]|uniref:Pentatricopeptide repeat-containing protein n=1 Tax=Solanum verrucosum TaxID=315347 RepID=A0AAF0PKZ9_SOLVR|nr:hypothetical protein MTR67_000268 [Solanum verrucosum]